MEVIELWPFSQGESSGEPDRFVDAAFRHGPSIDHSSPLRRRNYLDRLVGGGFPEAVSRASRRRTAFFDSYLSTLIERDVLELASIERRGDLLKTARTACRTGWWCARPGCPCQPIRHPEDHPDALSGSGTGR
jgi:predicted AAA+ superfamily ATPase